MRLSLRAIWLFRMKFGKGPFWGFEEIEGFSPDSVTEEDEERNFQELTKSGLIQSGEDGIGLSLLAQHFCSMMVRPRQMILLDNGKYRRCVRLYFRDTYYLCVMEDKGVTSPETYDRFQITLLPRLELVTGALAYALEPGEEGKAKEDEGGGAEAFELQVMEKGWDPRQRLISEVCIRGSYEEERLRCLIQEDGKQETMEWESWELVNQITRWLFQRLGEGSEGEE